MLRSLMLDTVPSIQQTAALALGRLADQSDSLAEAVVKEDILPQLVQSLASQNVSTSSPGLLPSIHRFSSSKISFRRHRSVRIKRHLAGDVGLALNLIVFGLVFGISPGCYLKTPELSTMRAVRSLSSQEAHLETRFSVAFEGQVNLSILNLKHYITVFKLELIQGQKKKITERGNNFPFLKCLIVFFFFHTLKPFVRFC